MWVWGLGGDGFKVWGLRQRLRSRSLDQKQQVTEQSSADRASKSSQLWAPILPRNPMEGILSSGPEHIGLEVWNASQADPGC